MAAHTLSLIVIIQLADICELMSSLLENGLEHKTKVGIKGYATWRGAYLLALGLYYDHRAKHEDIAGIMQNLELD